MTSDQITRDPEIGFKEDRAVKILMARLTKYGFEPEAGIGGMRTAFIAKYKRKGDFATQSGPHLGGCVDCIGLATINRTTGAVTFNAAYYALGHVSKFVQRGANRVASMSLTSYREGQSSLPNVLEAQRNAREILAHDLRRLGHERAGSISRRFHFARADG